MKKAADRLRKGATLMAGVMAVVLFAVNSSGAQVNRTEGWNDGLLNGWTDEAQYAATLGNPGTYLQLSFPVQSILMPMEDGVVGGVDASGGVFSGDYVAAGVSGISFSLMTGGTLPATMRLVLHSSVSDREWSYAPLEVSGSAGVWVYNSVPLEYSGGKWRLSGPGASEAKFLDDLKSVDRIGIRVQQNGTVAQAYCIDEFRLMGLKGTIRGKVTYSGFQSGSVKVIAAGVAGSWVPAHAVELKKPGEYEISNVDIERSYWVKAYIDANGNGVPDEWEPMGEYVSNSVYVVSSVDGVDITLKESMTADGLPQWWVKKHAAALVGGITNIVADADNDNDGMSNLHEYMAGTDPNNADSVFKVKGDKKPATVGIELKWPSSYVGQKFEVWRCTDLMVGFTLLQGGIAGTPPENTYADVTAIGPGPYYYKIKIVQ